jgi:hypothetical protein
MRFDNKLLSKIDKLIATLGFPENLFHSLGLVYKSMTYDRDQWLPNHEIE